MQQGLQTDAICNIQKSCGCLQGALSSAFNHILSVCNLQLNQSRCLTRLPFWGFISSMCCFIACHIPDRRWRAQIGFHQISPSALLTRNLGYETIRYTHCLNYWKLGGGRRTAITLTDKSTRHSKLKIILFSKQWYNTRKNSTTLKFSFTILGYNTRSYFNFLIHLWKWYKRLKAFSNMTLRSMFHRFDSSTKFWL